MKNRLLKRSVASVTLALLFATASCRKQSPTIDDIAQRYARLVTALGARDTDSLDFSLATPETKAEIGKDYPSLDQLQSEDDALFQAINQLAVTDRSGFLKDQILATKDRILQLRGTHLDFEHEALLYFSHPPLPDTFADERGKIRAKIASMLPLSKKPLADRYADYAQHFIVPSDKLLTVFNAALSICRARTLEHIQLPANESTTVELVRDQPWAAFSRYQGSAHSLIQLNTDFPMTPDDAIELACHEGYPGHHTFNTVRDVTLVQQQHLTEFSVQPTFSPQSYVSEAAAAYAPEMAVTLDERAALERDELFPLAGLPPAEAARFVQLQALVRQLDSAEPSIAEAYVDGKLEFVRAEQALAEQSLIANAGPMLLYLNEYRSYMLTYTDGPRRIAAVMPADRAGRWQTYERIMRTGNYTFAP